MQGTLKVQPEVLISTATEFNSKGSRIRNLLSEMMSKVTSTNSIWEGEAQSAYAAKFKGLEDDIQKMIKMVSEHSTDLREMAAEYNRAERENMNEISSLSSDVIV